MKITIEAKDVNPAKEEVKLILKGVAKGLWSIVDPPKPTKPDHCPTCGKPNQS